MAARLRILAVGTRMPAWVQTGFAEYHKRMPRDFAVELREVPVSRREGARAVAEEGEALLAHPGPDGHVGATGGGVGFWGGNGGGPGAGAGGGAGRGARGAGCGPDHGGPRSRGPRWGWAASRGAPRFSRRGCAPGAAGACVRPS